MTRELTSMGSRAPLRHPNLRLDRNPSAVYLAGLGPGSRRTMQAGLDTVAGWLSGGQADALGAKSGVVPGSCFYS